MAEGASRTGRRLLHRGLFTLDVLASVSIVLSTVVIIGQWWRPSTPTTSSARELAIPSAPMTLDGAALTGQVDAEAVMVAFSDFECPYCGKFSREVLPAIDERYIREGRLLFAFRHLPLPNHANAKGAAMAATCADEQNRFLPFHDVLFANPNALDAGSLRSHGASVGLDPVAYDLCMEQVAPGRVNSDTELARRLGVTGTPAFFVGTRRPDGRVDVKHSIVGARPLDEFLLAINQVLAAGL